MTKQLVFRLGQALIDLENRHLITIPTLMAFLTVLCERFDRNNDAFVTMLTNEEMQVFNIASQYWEEVYWSYFSQDKDETRPFKEE